MRMFRPVAISIAVLFVSVAVVFAGVRLRELRTDERIGAGSVSQGWLADSSAALVTATRAAGGRGVMLLGRDGRLTDTGLDAPSEMLHPSVAVTGDGRWLGLVQGDVLTVASIDGRTKRAVETMSRGSFVSGWLDDQHLLYARADAQGGLAYRTADRQGVTADVPTL